MEYKKYKDYIVVPPSDKLFPEKFGFHELRFNELLELYEEDNIIPYSQYLRTYNWKIKRLEIFERDNYRCVKCGNFPTVIITKSLDSPFGKILSEKLEWSDLQEVGWIDENGNNRVCKVSSPVKPPVKSCILHVHHKKYIINRLPWQYSKEDLITLCHHCHAETHKHEHIPIFDEYGNINLEYTECQRCNGAGVFPEYKHVKNGVCFECNGDRFNIPLNTSKVFN